MLKHILTTHTQHVNACWSRPDHRHAVKRSIAATEACCSRVLCKSGPYQRSCRSWRFTQRVAGANKSLLSHISTSVGFFYRIRPHHERLVHCKHVVSLRFVQVWQWCYCKKVSLFLWSSSSICKTWTLGFFCFFFYIKKPMVAVATCPLFVEEKWPYQRH